MTLADVVAARIGALTPPDATLLVAVSGGPDSLALLDLLQLTRSVHGRDLVVGHVDHGIHPESAVVAARVAAAAEGYGLRVLSRALTLGAGTSETRAREGRRAALREMADACGAARVVLAHHADDQAETVLLRLLRGSGPAGLAGMAARTGLWVRPLLRIRRAELVEHLAGRGIAAWDDPANRDPAHLRSWLRGEILPRLAERLPDVTERLLDVGAQAGSAREAWDAVPALLEGLDLRQELRGISVAAPPLRGYRSSVQRAVLAALGRRFGVSIGAARRRAIERLWRAGEGTVQLAKGLSAELAFGRLTFFDAETASAPPVELADGATAVGHAHFTRRDAIDAWTPSRGGWTTRLAPGRYLVRTWRRGDRIRPLGGQGSRAVSVLLREARIAPSRRPDWPVVLDAATATVVWVPGICRAEGWIPQEGAGALHVECAVA